MAAPAIELAAVVKNYHSLRPLRIRDLVVSEREIVALSGLDAPATEILTSLVTAATLPDEGVVRVFGDNTAAVGDADEWIAALDRFGLVSDRVALLDGFTAAQNIAIPLTLDLDPLPDAVAEAVRLLAAAAGISSGVLGRAAGELSAEIRLRVRIARALAPAPRLLLLEHPTATLARDEVRRAAADFHRLARSRAMAALVVTADAEFARQADRWLVLDPATGRLDRARRRRWFA